MGRLLILALFSVGAGPARALDCPALLEASFRKGRPLVAPCLAPGATWRDAAGLRRGTAAFVEGFADFLEARPELPARGLTRVLPAAASTQFFADASSETGDGYRRYYVLAVDRSTAGWEAVRVYQAARPWPGVDLSTDTPPPGRHLDEMVAGFNERFASGDLDGWLRLWQPDAVFHSVIGPFAGPEVREFFAQQARRYVGPRVQVDRVHSGPGSGGTLIEGAIQGRCREGGEPFELDYVMLLRFREDRAALVYEAFLSAYDGCGPFWTGPR